MPSRAGDLDQRADLDAVQLAEPAVAVVGDRDRPAVAGGPPAASTARPEWTATAANADPGDGPARERLQRVDLPLAGGLPGDEEREHDRRAVADVERPGIGPRRVAAGTGVDVAAERAGGQRGDEAVQRLARR